MPLANSYIPLLARAFRPIYLSHPLISLSRIQLLSPYHTSKISSMEAKFSDGEDKTKLVDQVEAMLKNGWELDEHRMGIRKTFYFKTYTKVLDFVQVVGIRSKSQSHHSVMQLGTGYVSILWTTHYPRGLSNKDITMAQYSDEQGKLIKTVDKNEAQKCGPPS